MSWIRACFHCLAPLKDVDGMYRCQQADCGNMYDKESYHYACETHYGVDESAGIPENIFKKWYKHEQYVKRRSSVPHWRDWDAIGISNEWSGIRYGDEAWRQRDKNSLDTRIIPDGCDCKSKLCTWRGSLECAHPLPKDPSFEDEVKSDIPKMRAQR